MFTQVKKKILVIIMMLALLLTQFSTTIYAVSDEIENIASTSSSTLTSSEDTSSITSSNENEEDENTEEQAVADDVELNVDYSYSEDSLSCDVVITSNVEMYSIYLDEEEATSFTLSEDSLSFTATFTENVSNTYTVTFEEYESTDITVEIDRIADLSVEEEVTVEEVEVMEEAGIALLSVDDGIAVVASSESGDYILGIETDDTVYLGIIDGTLDKLGHEMHYAKYQGTSYIAFCVQYDITSPGDTFTVGDDVQVVHNASDYEKIAKMIFFGYTSKYGTSLPSTTAQWQAACATQQYVWEYIYKYVNSGYGYPDRDSWNSTYMSSSIYADWLEETEEAYSEYYDNEVSFDGKTYEIGLGESKTITDTQGSLQYYPNMTKTAIL